jgi:hypothetical protein
LQNRKKLGLPVVSSSWNGFHLSAGPVEGLVELIRYTSDFSQHENRNYKDFSFGKRMASTFNGETINRILNNDIVDTGAKRISVFDLTEEKDSREAMEILQQYF